MSTASAVAYPNSAARRNQEARPCCAPAEETLICNCWEKSAAGNSATPTPGIEIELDSFGCSSAQKGAGLVAQRGGAHAAAQVPSTQRRSPAAQPAPQSASLAWHRPSAHESGAAASQPSCSAHVLLSTSTHRPSEHRSKPAKQRCHGGHELAAGRQLPSEQRSGAPSGHAGTAGHSWMDAAQLPSEHMINPDVHGDAAAWHTAAETSHVPDAQRTYAAPLSEHPSEEQLDTQLRAQSAPAATHTCANKRATPLW
eukprot:6212471-Pleurochrysis_carterae.AAC.4